MVEEARFELPPKVSGIFVDLRFHLILAEQGRLPGESGNGSFRKRDFTPDPIRHCDSRPWPSKLINELWDNHIPELRRIFVPLPVSHEPIDKNVDGCLYRLMSIGDAHGLEELLLINIRDRPCRFWWPRR